MLQFITNSNTVAGTIAQAEQAMLGGCRWVQVRMKNSTDDEVREAIKHLLPICDSCSTTLIIDDKVQLVKELNAHGVHLGQNDMSPDEARDILGPNKIIGYTINNLQHAQNALHLPIDYVGMGPWRFTTTKQKLAPVLGANGIKQLITFLRDHAVNIPVVAIGGIKVDDIADVMSIGANGIAISGEIAHAENPINQTRLFIESLKQYKNNGK